MSSSCNSGASFAQARPVTIEISYFAWVRERMGCSFERLVLPGDRMTIRDLVDWLQRRDARGVAAFCEPERLRAALDGRMVPLDTFSGSAGELAIFPPVTGG